MSDASGPALEEVVRDFSRAKDELSRLSETFRDITAVADERRAERDSLKGAAEQLSASASHLRQLTDALEGAITSVGQVLVAAEGALRGTDAGQLAEKMDSLGTSVERSNESLNAVRQSVQQIPSALEQRFGRVEQQLQSGVTSTNDGLSQLTAQVTRLMGEVGAANQLDEERRQLQVENNELRAQMEKVRRNLKPRQLAMLGLEE